MKRALISGMNGFIGSHLAHLLTHLDIDPLPLDRRLLLDGFALKRSFLNEHFDYIFHLAAYGNMHSQTRDNEIITTNVVGTWNLMQAVNDIDYEAFINFSSSSVLLPTPTIYSASKLSTEIICNAYANKHKKSIVSVRPSTVYGVNDNTAHLIPQVIHNILDDIEMKLVKPPKHDYIYVEDLVRGVMVVANNAKRLRGESINISTGVQYSNGQIVKTIEKLMGKKLKYKEVESLRSYDTKNWKVDNEHIKSLGWQPEISLEEGLTACIEDEIDRPEYLLN